MTTGVFFSEIISGRWTMWHRWKVESGQGVPLDEHGIVLYPPWGAPLARFPAAFQLAYGR